MKQYSISLVFILAWVITVAIMAIYTYIAINYAKHIFKKLDWLRILIAWLSNYYGFIWWVFYIRRDHKVSQKI